MCCISNFKRWVLLYVYTKCLATPNKIRTSISLLKSRNWESRSRNVKEQQKITVFIIWGIVFVLWRLKLDDRPGDVTPTTCMYVWNIKKPGGKLRGGGRCGYRVANGGKGLMECGKTP